MRNLFLFQKQDDQCKGREVNCIGYNTPFYENILILNKPISRPVRKSSYGFAFKIKSLSIPSGSTRCNFSSKTDLSVCGVCLKADITEQLGTTSFIKCTSIQHCRSKIYCSLCFGIVTVLAGFGVKIIFKKEKKKNPKPKNPNKTKTKQARKQTNNPKQMKFVRFLKLQPVIVS